MYGISSFKSQTRAAYRSIAMSRTIEESGFMEYYPGKFVVESMYLTGRLRFFLHRHSDSTIEKNNLQLASLL